MSVSTNIKQHIISNVQACPSVDKVYGHEEKNPTGWPAVMVTAGDMQGEFASNAQNSRTYSFRVHIFFPTSQDFVGNSETNRYEYAEQVVATVIDELINVFDTDFVLAGSDATVLYVEAADAIWGYLNIEVGEVRTARITLNVYTEKTVV